MSAGRVAVPIKRQNGVVDHARIGASFARETEVSRVNALQPDCRRFGDPDRDAAAGAAGRCPITDET